MEEPTRTKLGCNHEFVQYGKQCKHGQLKRSCEICELEARVKELELQVEVLERKLKDKETELEFASIPF